MLTKAGGICTVTLMVLLAELAVVLMLVLMPFVLQLARRVRGETCETTCSALRATSQTTTTGPKGSRP